MTVPYLLDLISRTLSVMDVQLDENGETIRQGNDELYDDLKDTHDRLARGEQVTA